MQGVVGDEESGLVADVAANAEAISELQGVVGDEESGLVADVAANAEAISELQGVVGDEESGLVADVAANAEAISELQGVVGDEESGLVADVAANSEAISELQGVVGDEESGLVADVAANSEAISELQGVVGDEESGLVADVAANAEAISGLQEDLGDVSQFASSETGNLSYTTGVNATSAADAIVSLDEVVGKIDGLAATLADEGIAANLDSHSTVSSHLVALAGAIGDRTNFEDTTTHLQNNADIAEALVTLDGAIGDVEDFIGEEDISGLGGTITEAILGLDDKKQDKLIIADNSGLQWTNTDETKLAVKFSDASGLKVTSDGITIKVGNTMEIGNEGHLNVKFDTDTFQADQSEGLQIKDKGILAGMIDDGAVDTDQLADEAVTHDKLADDAVETNNIADDAVTFAKINDDAIAGDSDAIIAGSDAKLATAAAVKAYAASQVEENTFEKKTTFGETAGQQVIIDNNGEMKIDVKLNIADAALSQKTVDFTGIDGTTETDQNILSLEGVDAFVAETSVATTSGFSIVNKTGTTAFQELISIDAEGITITKDGTEDGITFEVDSEDGSLVAAAGKFEVDENGAISAADEKFIVDENGAISAVGGKFIATDEGIGLFANPEDTDNTFSVTAEDGAIYAAAGNFQVDGDGDITSKGTLSVSDGKFEVDGDGAFRAASEKFIVDSDGAMSAADGNFMADVDGNIYAAGDADIDGDLSVGDKFSVKAEDGSFSAAGGKFAVNENGSIAAADNKFVVNKDGNITKAGTISAADGTFLVKEGGAVSAAAGKFEVKEGGLISAAAGTFQVKDGGTVSAADGLFEVKEGGLISAAAGKFEVKEDGAVTAAGGNFMIDEDGNTLAESLAFNSNPEAFVDTIDQAEATIIDGEVTDERKQTMATNATIAKTIGNLAALTDDPAGVTGTADVATVILTLSNNVEAATGGEFDDTGAWSGTIDNSGDTNSYVYSANENIMDALDQIAANIGTAEQLANTFNGVEVANSVNSNINALNGTMGDITELNTELKNLTNGGDTAPETFVEAFNNLDATLGRVHGLVESEDATTTVNGDDYAGNLAVGDATVEKHLLALDGSIGDRRSMDSANTEINEATKESIVAGLTATGNAIGDMDFSAAHYYTSSGADANLSDAVRTLDNNMYRIDNDLRDLRHDFYRGMASMAAMSALTPNARSKGNTSLSLGTGAYNGHTAMALGGFHYLTDNLLLNAGAAWGDSKDMSYRLGVTWSF